jgi:uncharacterized protein YciI
MATHVVGDPQETGSADPRIEGKEPFFHEVPSLAEPNGTMGARPPHPVGAHSVASTTHPAMLHETDRAGKFLTAGTPRTDHADPAAPALVVIDIESAPTAAAARHALSVDPARRPDPSGAILPATRIIRSSTPLLRGSMF